MKQGKTKVFIKTEVLYEGFFGVLVWVCFFFPPHSYSFEGVRRTDNIRLQVELQNKVTRLPHTSCLARVPSYRELRVI